METVASTTATTPTTADAATATIGPTLVVTTPPTTAATACLAAVPDPADVAIGLGSGVVLWPDPTMSVTTGTNSSPFATAQARGPPARTATHPTLNPFDKEVIDR